MATAWALTKGLDRFRGQVNSRFPLRDKASDGTIGDLAHQNESSSGHNPDITGRAEWKDGDKLNEVRAWDMDSDLHDKFGYTAEKLVQYLVGLGRAGKYLPFRYIIFNKRIWRKANGWKTQEYNGPSAHTEHIHFSGDFSETADNWDGDLGIAKVGIPVPKPPTVQEDEVKAEDIEAIANLVVKKLTTQTKFTDAAGGQGSPISQAVMNGDYPVVPGAKRTHVWQNFQRIHTTLDKILAAVTTKPATGTAPVPTTPPKS